MKRIKRKVTFSGIYFIKNMPFRKALVSVLARSIYIFKFRDVILYIPVFSFAIMVTVQMYNNNIFCITYEKTFYISNIGC